VLFGTEPRKHWRKPLQCGYGEDYTKSSEYRTSVEGEKRIAYKLV